MIINRDEFTLLDLIDINLLQKFQDFFAKAMDVASITLDKNGPITAPSNYTDFCKININNRGHEDMECDLHNPKWGEIAFEKKEPLIYKCRTGLTSFVVPIVIDDKHLGSIVCGQIFTESPNEELFKETALKEGQNVEEYINNLRKIKIMPIENVKASIDLLLLLVNTISEISHKNLEIIEKNRREDLYRNMVETIRSSLDLDKTLNIISSEISKLFNLQRVAILQFPNKKKLNYFDVRKEYITKKTIKSWKELEGYYKIGEFVANEFLKSHHPFVVNNLEDFGCQVCPDFFRDFYLALGVKSVVWLPIIAKEELWGFVSLSKTESFNWTNNDISLLESVASQLYMAINQAELYEEEKKTAEKEAVVRKTIEVLRSKLNPEEIKKYFIDITGSYFDADICIFEDYDKETGKFPPFQYERLKSPDTPSLIGIDPEVEFPEFLAKIKRRRAVIVKDVDKLCSKKNIQNFKALQSMHKGGAKSAYGFPVEYEGNLMGILILHFLGQGKILGDEDLDFLKILGDQVGVALNQAELYTKERKTAEREALLRRIVEFLRSKLDPEEIKKYFVKIIGAYFNADRCLFIDYDKYTDKMLPIKIEALKSSEIISLINLNVEANLPEFVNELKKRKNIIIPDFDKILSRKKVAKYQSLKFLYAHGVKSDYALMVEYERQIVGVLVIHFIGKKRVLKRDEFDFLKVLRDQVGIALYQTDLYITTKQQTEREKTLRDIISKMRNSLDIEEIKHEIVNQIGNLFSADRVTVVYYDKQLNNYTATPDGEYRSSDKVKTFVGVDFVGTPGFAEYIRAIHFRGQDIIFNNLEEYLDDNNYRNTDIENFYKEFGFISSAAINMYYEDVFLGDLVVTFEKQRNFSEEELKFLKILADQTGVAFHQAELYNNAKQTADREVLLRNIIETIRSTLNLNETKATIVKEIGTALNADRVFIVEFDPQTNTPGVLDKYSEYLSSPEEFSYVAFDFSSPEVEFLANAHKNTKMVLIQNVEKFIEENNLKNSKEDDWIRKSNLKSGVGVPIYYGNQIYGVMAIHYIRTEVVFTDEQIKFIKALADQTGIAIYQARLFEKEKQTAEKEALLRKIIETVRSSMDITEVKKNITTELGNALNADRCFFRTYDKIKNRLLPMDVEYLSSPDVKSLLNFEFNQPVFQLLNYFSGELSKLKKGFYPVIIDVESKKGTPIELFMQKFDTKTICAIPIIFNDEELTWLALHYTKKEQKIDEDSKKLLETISYQISIAFNQIKLYHTVEKTAERESLLRSIIETIRSSLNIGETKQKIVDIVGKTFNADRCFILEYTKIKDEFLKVDNEYLSSDNISSYADTNVNINVPNFMDAFREGKPIVVKDKKIFVDGDHHYYTPETEAIEAFNVNSAYGFPLFYKKELLGVLGIHYVNIEHEIDDEEIDLISKIVYQVSIAIYQAKLFNQIQQSTANQTAILNNMPFMAWLKDENSRLLAINTEYAKMCNSTVDNVIGKTDFDYFPQDQAESYVKEDKLVMQIKQPISSSELITGPEGERWHETYKSPIFDSQGNSVGTVGIARDITDRIDRERKLLQRQKAIIKANERENLLRKILQTMRSSLDINVIKQSIVEEVGKALQADTCFILTYEHENDIFTVDEHSEYRSSPELKSFIGVDSKDLKYKWFVDLFKQNREVNFRDVDEYIVENKLEGTLEDKFLHDYNIKSAYNIAIYYAEHLIGYLILHYNKSYKIFDENETEFVRTIATQAGVAFHQAELYQKTKLLAERESLLRTISEAIMSTLDIEEVKNRIVNVVGSSLNADRCIIVEYDNETKKYLKVNNEYLSTDDIVEFKGVDVNIDVPLFANGTKNGHPVVINNREIYLNGDYLDFEKEKYAIEKYNVYSAFAYPLYYENEFMGVISAHYVRKHFIDEDEINLVKIIANQVSVALHQAKLYKLTQMQAEREKISRRMLEILRSSLDKKTIKHLFVQNIGKFFNADRVLFSEYDYKNNMYLPVDKYSEYLSNKNEKSFIGYDWSQDEAREYIQPLLEKRELLIDCWDEYIKTHNIGYDFIRLFEDANVQSSYNLPVLYQEEIIGYFCVEFTGNACKKLPTEDINRLRNICAQTAIALYHSELYVNAIESASSKESFIENISSELHIPLNNITNIFIEFSTAEFNEEIRTNFFSTLNENYKQLLDLKNNIGAVAQIESENFKLNYKKIDSEQLITEVCNPLKHIADNKSITIDVELVKVHVDGDELRLKQAFYNILNTIISITPESGHLQIKSEFENNQLIISILDFGTGLDFDTQNKIFETLKQIDSSSTMLRKNLSLGLSVTKKIIELHKGYIYVDSTDDKGTKVRFIFPKVRL